ncbi:hypothetical protein CEP51_007518 [Fusarium floridanum]|uniref:RING-type domain-containing protein n=1 Tax=Fusarium floridanum TaxID=1325733 RepID=A0A428RNW3_9HYPO|nr:hypothetical protein CEP51_007518 [Fusarium floridanum]
MCIKVDRWFYCSELGQGPPVPPERQVTNTYEDFWTHWQHEETVGHEEQQELDLPTFPGYHYIRHKDERWIRCAMTRSNDCLECPLEIRTEIYNIPCPNCSQDDPCILSAQPLRTYKNPSPNMTPERFAFLAQSYAYEVISILISFFRIEIYGRELTEPDWDAYLRGLYCTQDSNHILPDRLENPDGPLMTECHMDCACTLRPWAHNLSRAARNQNAHQVRFRSAQEWFYFVYTDAAPTEWISRFFGNIPNQLWLNMHEDGPQRFLDGIALITKAANDLGRLGPGIQVEAWQLIFLPCLDPGITAEFLNYLLRQHFLTALCPYLNITNDRIHILDCQVEPSDTMKMLLFHSHRVFGDDDQRHEAALGGIRESELVDALQRNRAICQQNSMVKKQLAEGFALTCVANAVASNQTCAICGDDLDDANPTPQIPTHIRPVEMPCCHQFMHVRCLKGTVLHGKTCPLCNRKLKEVGLSMERFAPGQNIQREVRHVDLPEGMMRYPNDDEIELVEYDREAIFSAIANRIRRDQGLPPIPGGGLQFD